MGGNSEGWSRRALALERRVREIETTLGGGAGTPALPVVDPKTPVFPHRVLRDAVLEPVDKVVWMVLRASAARGRLAGPHGVKGCSRFPGYARIGACKKLCVYEPYHELFERRKVWQRSTTTASRVSCWMS